MESTFVRNSIWIGFRRHFVIWDQYTLWNSQLSFQPTTRFRCDVVARHWFPKHPPGSQISFFSWFSKKSKNVGQKGGTGWCLHLWLIDFKRGHFWSSLRIMRQTTKAHWACPYPQILFAKSDYFPKEQKQKRTGFPRFWFASLNVKSASRKNNRVS